MYHPTGSILPKTVAHCGGGGGGGRGGGGSLITVGTDIKGNLWFHDKGNI